MNYIELSREDAQKEAKRLAELIKNDFEPNAVVFVAKGAYQIGLDIGEFFHIPVMEIFAERKANRIKRVISPLLKCLPSKWKRMLRAFEVNSNVHVSQCERNVYWGDIPPSASGKDFKNIILVDDSSDTGNTFKQCVDVIRHTYPHADVKTAAINVFEVSFAVFKTDFFLYKDCMISGPWSNDSIDHNYFLDDYKKYKYNMFNNSQIGENR
jgi:hypoxanthine phosphoribosyltransferase